VSPLDAISMTELTPTQRLEWILLQDRFAATHPTVKRLLDCYEEFIGGTDAPEEALIEVFLDAKKSLERFRSANHLGNFVFEALESIGQRNRFHRLLVV
jgi:hypothetical protein